jgi:hypothetical protein
MGYHLRQIRPVPQAKSPETRRYEIWDRELKPWSAMKPRTNPHRMRASPDRQSYPSRLSLDARRLGGPAV